MCSAFTMDKVVHLLHHFTTKKQNTKFCFCLLSNLLWTMVIIQVLDQHFISGQHSIPKPLLEHIFLENKSVDIKCQPL